MLPYLLGSGSFLLVTGVLFVVLFFNKNKALEGSDYYKLYKKIALSYSWILVIFFIGIVTLALLLKNYYILILLSVVLTMYLTIIARIAHYFRKD